MPRRHRTKGGNWPHIGRALASYGSGEWGLPDVKKALHVKLESEPPYRCAYCGHVPRLRTLVLHGDQWFCKATKACEERGRWDDWEEPEAPLSARKDPPDPSTS